MFPPLPACRQAGGAVFARAGVLPNCSCHTVERFLNGPGLYFIITKIYLLLRSSNLLAVSKNRDKTYCIYRMCLLHNLSFLLIILKVIN